MTYQLGHLFLTCIIVKHAGNTFLIEIRYLVKIKNLLGSLLQINKGNKLLICHADKIDPVLIMGVWCSGEHIGLSNRRGGFDPRHARQFAPIV